MSGRRHCRIGAAGALGGVVLELGVALGFGGPFVLQIGWTVRAERAEQLHEQAGLREVGLHRLSERGAALHIVAFRHHPGAELLEIGLDLFALVIEIVGGLGEQDGLSAERAFGLRRLGTALMQRLQELFQPVRQRLQPLFVFLGIEPAA